MRLLSGPVVRRVEPRRASVWVATDVACDIDLHIWNDVQSVSALTSAQYHAKARTLFVGANLHVGLVVADLTDAAEPLIPERVYSYNLSFSPDGGAPEDLQSLGLLKDRTTPKPHLALGYATDVLPSFVLPPRELKDLRILHGSCRRIGFDGPDAMMWIDDLIRESRMDAIHRPHQLFLTGDQIYADNLPTELQHVLTNVGNEMLGSVEQLPTRFSMAANPPVVRLLPCDTKTFPAGLRKNLIMHDARMSTSDGANHLLSFGEFCAMHVFAWSNEAWPDRLPTLKRLFPRLKHRTSDAGDPVEPDEPDEPTEPPELEGILDPLGETDILDAGVPSKLDPPRARERCDVYDLRRPRDHRRLELQPNLERPRAHVAAWPDRAAQRACRIHAFPGLGQRSQGVQRRRARPRRHAQAQPAQAAAGGRRGPSAPRLPTMQYAGGHPRPPQRDHSSYEAGVLHHLHQTGTELSGVEADHA